VTSENSEAPPYASLPLTLVRSNILLGTQFSSTVSLCCSFWVRPSFNTHTEQQIKL